MPSVIPLTPDQISILREEIAKSLNVDVARVVSEATFFCDLGGIVEQLRPLRDSLMAKFGSEIPFVVDSVSALTMIHGGLVAENSIYCIRSYLGDWSKAPVADTAFSKMFTVGMIAAIAAKAIEIQKKNSALPSLKNSRLDLLAMTFAVSLQSSFDPLSVALFREFGGNLGWLREFLLQLEPRALRLLLVACVRDTCGSLDPVRDKDEVKVLNALDGFADTGLPPTKQWDKWKDRYLKWGSSNSYPHRSLWTALFLLDTNPGAALLQLVGHIRGAHEITEDEAFDRLRVIFSQLAPS